MDIMLCPLIKDECKTSQCVMWVTSQEYEKGNGEGFCLLVKGLTQYLDQFRVDLTSEDQEKLKSMMRFIEEGDPKELAEEVLEFIKQEVEKYQLSPDEMGKLSEYALLGYLQKKFGQFAMSFLEDNPIFRLKVYETRIILDNKLNEQIDQKMEQKMKSVNIDELVNEYIDYLKGKVNSEKISALYDRYYLYINEFLAEKGLPDNYETKRLLRENTRILLREEMEKERERLEREQIMKEKELVPRLVEGIIEWAKANNLKRIRKTDVEAFIIEKNLGDLHYLTKDSIWKLANAKLKRQK